MPVFGLETENRQDQTGSGKRRGKNGNNKFPVRLTADQASDDFTLRTKQRNNASSKGGEASSTSNSGKRQRFQRAITERSTALLRFARKFSFFAYHVAIIVIAFLAMQVAFVTYLILARAEETPRVTIHLEPEQCAGWENSSAATHTDLLGTSTASQFSKENSANFSGLFSPEHAEKLEMPDEKILCTGYRFPNDLPAGVKLQTGRLSVSFGATSVAGSEDVVSFSFSTDGENWSPLDSIALIDDVSNAANEGYRTFLLPETFTLDSLDAFSFRADYHAGETGGAQAFLDGAKLELDLFQPPDIAEELRRSVRIEQVDFSATESPAVFVDVETKPFFSFLGAKPETRRVTSVSITDPSGQAIEIPYTVDREREGRTTTARYRLESHALTKPGKYDVTITVEQEGYTETVTQSFRWGVLAINPDQSVYRAGDLAELSIGVVDDIGKIVCDAEVELTIVSPSGQKESKTTKDKGIEITDFCGVKETYKKPDYRTTFNPVEAGQYELQLSATHHGATHTIKDGFEVQDQPKFTIQRIGPTRVFPVLYQPMALTVTAYEDFSGPVRELVPGDFEDIKPEDGGVVAPYDTGTEIAWGVTWEVALKAGESTTLHYRFKSVERSPALYLGGPASIGESWNEGRQWQFAIDPPFMWLLGNSGTAPSGWTNKTGFDYYPRGAATTATTPPTGGATTHTDTIASQSRNAPTTLGTTFDCDITCGSTATSGHTHTVNTTTVGSANNDPLSYTFFLWAHGTGVPSKIPQNAFALFDAAPSGSDWTRFSSADNRVVKIAQAHGTAGTSDTHTHSLTWGSLAAASGSIIVDTGGSPTGATATHTHTAPSATTSASYTSIPSNIQTLIYQQTNAGGVATPNGMIAMFDSAPPSGWTTVAGAGQTFNAQFIRGSSSYSATPQSSDTHSMANETSGNSGTPSATTNRAAGSSGAGNGHRHTITATFNANTDHKPQYFDVIMAKCTASGGCGTIDLSGVAYQGNESTPINGTSPNKTVTLWVNGSATACGGAACTDEITDATGAWAITGITANNGDIITVFLDDETEEGTTVFKTDGTDQTNVNIFQNAVIVRNDVGTSITNTNLESGDRDVGDNDVKFDVSSGDVSVDSGFELHVWTADTFDPNGKVTTQGTGDLHVDDSATMYLDTGGVGTESTIAAEISVDTSATLNVSANVKVNGTGTALLIGGGTLNHSAGTFDIGNSTDEDLQITSGAIDISGTAIMNIADFFDMNGGTVDIASTVNIVGHLDSGLDVDGGTLNIKSGADVNITGATSDFLVDGASTVVNLGTVGSTNGSVDAGRYFRWNTGATINLRGGNHHTGAAGGGTNATWEMANASNLTFNMISGTDADPTTGCNITASQILIYGAGAAVFSTPTVTGGTLCMGTSHTTRQLYDTELETSHSLYNLYIVETGNMHATSTATITIDNDFKIFSGKTFSGNNDTISVGHDWINNGGTFTAQTSTIKMAGTAGGINGTADTTFNNLNIDPSSAGTVTVGGLEDPTVSGTLTVAASDTLSISSSRVLTHTGTSDVAGTGTISGAGTLRFTSSTTGGPGTTLITLSVPVRFDASAASIPGAVFDGRTYGGAVELYANSGTGKSVSTVAAGTYTLSSTLTITTAGAGATTLDMNTTDPTTFTVSGTLTIGATSVLQATSSGTFNVNGNYTNGGTFTHNSGTVTMNSTSSIDGTVDTTFNSLSIGDGTDGTVTINGTDDPTVAGTLTVDTGDTLSVGSGRVLTHTGTADVAGAGNISGAGRLDFTSSTTGGPGTTLTTLSVPVRFDASAASIPAAVFDARTYGGAVDFYSAGGAARTVTAPTSGTFNFDGAATTTCSSCTGGLTLDLDDTSDPTVNFNSNLTIGASTTLLAPSSTNLTLKGNYTNNGTFTHNNGTVLISGTSQQTLSGNMTDPNWFRNLTITNNSGSNPDSTPSVIFGASFTVTNQFRAQTDNVKLRFLAGGTYIINVLILNKSASGYIYLRSSTPGTYYAFQNTLANTVSDTNVRDSDASSGSTINANDGTSVNSGNNLNWNFGKIRVAGTLYQDDLVTPWNCNSDNVVIKISVNGDATPDSGTCTASNGTFDFTNITQPTAAGQHIVVYTDSLEAISATAATLSLNQYADANVDLYQYKVIIDHENSGPMTNTLLDTFDSGNDSGIDYTVNLSGTYNLTTTDNHGIVVWAGKSYTPGGTVTTPVENCGAGLSDVIIRPSATMTMGTNKLTVGGNFDTNVGGGGTFTASAGQDTEFQGISTTCTIDIDVNSFRDVIINASNTFQLTASTTTISEDLIMTLGTVSGSNSITVNGGDVTGDGDIDLSGGTMTVDGAGNFGGATAWTFNNLTFTGASSTTTATGSGGIEVTSVLTIGANHTLNAGSKTWTLSGSGTPFVVTGSFTASSSTVTYTGTSSTNIAKVAGGDLTYNHLRLEPTSGGPTYTLSNGTTTIGGNFIIGTPTLNAGSGTVVMTGTGNLQGSGRTLNNLTIGDGTAGTITVTSGFTVAGALNVVDPAASVNTLSISLNQSVTSTGTTAFNTSGTVSGAGLLIINSENTLDTGGTLSVDIQLRLDGASADDDILPARTYDGDVELRGYYTQDPAGCPVGQIGYEVEERNWFQKLFGIRRASAVGSWSEVIFQSGTYTFNGDLILESAGACRLGLNAADNDPTTVTIARDLLFTDTITPPSGTSGTIWLEPGAGTWIVGNNIDMGTFGSSYWVSESAAGTLRMTGEYDNTGTLTWGSTNNDKKLYNFETLKVGGTNPTITFTASVSVANNLTVNTNTTLVANVGNLNVGGNWDSSAASAVFTDSSGTVTFNGTTTGHTINTGSSNDFYNVTINGTGGAWSPLTNTMIIANDLIMTNGTFNTAAGTANVTVNGNVQCLTTCGTIDMNAGGTNTFTQSVATSKSFGTNVAVGTNWTFYNLTFTASTGTPTITTNATGTGQIIVANTLSTTNSGTSLVVDNETNDRIIDTSNVTIGAGTTLQASSTANFLVSGNWTNNGDFTDGSGTVTLDGAAQQTVAGQLTGASDRFFDLVITNASGSNPETSPSVIFAASADTADDFIAQTASTKIRFLAGGTYTFQKITFNGQATGTRVALRSSSTGTQWNLNVAGTRAVSNTDVRDSNACGQAPDIDATDGTNFDSTNNTCWLFETISFAITDVSVGFGNLTTGGARWASADENGSGSAVAAHTLQMTTNARNGYVISYKGSTLSAGGGDTITAGEWLDDADGTPGSEQFAISLATNGNATIESGYAYAGTPDYKFVPDTTTNIVSETSATSTETISVYYLTNIAGTTEAGTYTTSITYIATSRF